MWRQRAVCRITLLALLLTLAPQGVWALTDEELFRDFQFNFVNPSARSRGLGGAFIAAADDATAAEANPAALHYIGYKEIFFDIRLAEPDDSLVRPSMPFEADPSSPDPGFDFTAVNNTMDDEDISFASFSLPLNIKNRRATVAFSRQVQLRAENTLTAAGGAPQTELSVSLPGFPIVVVQDPIDGPTVRRATIDNRVQGMLDTELVNYNVGFSISATQDISFGATVTYAQLDVDAFTQSETFDPNFLLTNATHPRVDIFGPPSDPMGGATSGFQTFSDISDSDSGFAFAAGIHWHPDSLFESGVSPYKVGAVYRRGADLEVQQTLSRQTGTGDVEVFDEFGNTFKVPDRFGIGFAYQPRRFLLSFDVEQILYSDLLDGYQPGVNFFTSRELNFPSLIDDGIDTDAFIDSLAFDVDDATVVRLGVEYNIIARTDLVFSVRAGYFNDPDNKIALTDVETGDPAVDDLYLDLFRGGDDVDHITAGFSIGTERYQFQAAGDFADDETEIVLSGKFRIGKVR